MAMRKWLLRMLVKRGRTRSSFLNPILLAIEECEGLFSRTGCYDSACEVREIYLNGTLETYTGLMGNNALVHLLSHPEEDCLDDRQKCKDEEERHWMYVILMAAAYLGRVQDLKHLISLGLDVNRNHEGTWLYPPLIAASFGGQETANRVLVEHGADPHAVMRSNESSNENAIHFAARGGHRSLIKLVVGHGVNPRLRDLEGETPLIWAAAAKHPDVVRILLTYYSDVSEKRQQLEAALDWAADRSYNDVFVEILKVPHSRYNHTAPLDSAPLAVAAIMGRESVVQTLLNDPYVRGKERTIFRRALTAGDTTTVRAMIDTNINLLEQYQIV
ncbi:ankyrin repeat-containing domain protein [Aspergillus keveii]|uniref:Ankyrin repeat-containing domain protein n=1 Tax=Aspergillus keveii TaxID=714993 RepID=A0ABR4FQI5_9EURO